MPNCILRASSALEITPAVTLLTFPLCGIAMFALVRAGFATRRKTLRNALAAVLGERAEPVLRAAGIDPRARAETLGLDEWAALTRAAA